jgi:hypothetical protein
MLLNKNTLIVFGGLIIIGFVGVLITKLFEKNPEEPAELSPFIGIPIVLIFYYFYITNFSFITYIISIGAVFLLFL